MSARGRSVLIGFADALAAPEVAASLLAGGYAVVSFTRRGRPVALRKLRGVKLVEVTAPEEDLAACMREVAALAEAHDLTMPLDDQAVFVCDRALPAHTPLAGPRAAQAHLALDKRAQLRAAQDAGLTAPPWIELAAGEDAVSALPSDWEFPTVLKPALAAEEHDGRLRRLAPRLISSRAEAATLRHAWGESTPALVQQWVEGTGGGIFGLADAGGVHHLSAHRRVRMMNPAGSGSSACASASVPPELLSPVEQMLAKAGWRGMFMVELLRAQERWWFMELNGRPWGSLALTRRLGYEYPAWAAALAFDEEAPLPHEPQTSEDVLCRHLGRELVHLMFVLRGPRAHNGKWPGRRATVRALLGNPYRSAWYNLGPGMRGVFLDDALQTVANQTWRKGRA
ncbi:MAG: hypothetical protein ACRDJ3_00630 [Solirubrobacteraceae bacterium]